MKEKVSQTKVRVGVTVQHILRLHPIYEIWAKPRSTSPTIITLSILGTRQPTSTIRSRSYASRFNITCICGMGRKAHSVVFPIGE